MATIEDILEEIVGEITDEYDEENTDITALGDGPLPGVVAAAAGRARRALRAQSWTDEDVETVGGLMAKQLNKVPIAGSVVPTTG
jgi:Mg2+/Co2+ transporter CorC